ncbi:hypothetical protein [Bacillus phage vB_BanS-Thrax3]|nr:hypothetical protein [Bacillus phage vB_BanS-Thrax3]
MLTYMQLWWRVNGSAEFGRAIRWLYLYGVLSNNRFEKLDAKNFKKWQKKNDNKDYDSYLDIARL